MANPKDRLFAKRPRSHVGRYDETDYLYDNLHDKAAEEDSDPPEPPGIDDEMRQIVNELSKSSGFTLEQAITSAVKRKVFGE